MEIIGTTLLDVVGQAKIHDDYCIPTGSVYLASFLSEELSGQWHRIASHMGLSVPPSLEPDGCRTYRPTRNLYSPILPEPQALHFLICTEFFLLLSIDK